MSMEIAGVHFVITCRDSALFQEFPSIYQPFLKKNISESGSITIPIRLELYDIPDTGGMTKIFDTDQSWSMYRGDHEYIIALNPPILDKQTVWLARCNENFSNIVVYCSDMLERETDAGRKVLSPFRYPLDQLLLIHILARHRGVLTHAAGIALRGNGYIFPGCSGAGKSTLTKLLSSLKNVELLSDDRIVVRKIDGTFNAYGTPWSGELGIAANQRVPLSGIFLIRQGLAHCVKKIGPRQALEKLLPVISIPWYDRSFITEMLGLIEDLVSTVPVYELTFKKDIDVCQTFEAFVSR